MHGWARIPFLLFVSGTLGAFADEVTLDTGETLLGRIKRFDDEDLYLSVRYSEENIQIGWEYVTAFKTDSPIRVELRDGKSYFGNVEMNEAGKVVRRIAAPPAS